jgi:hypothetical protein
VSFFVAEISFIIAPTIEPSAVQPVAVRPTKVSDAISVSSGNENT